MLQSRLFGPMPLHCHPSFPQQAHQMLQTRLLLVHQMPQSHPFVLPHHCLWPHLRVHQRHQSHPSPLNLPLSSLPQNHQKHQSHLLLPMFPLLHPYLWFPLQQNPQRLQSHPSLLFDRLLWLLLLARQRLQSHPSLLFDRLLWLLLLARQRLQSHPLFLKFPLQLPFPLQ